VHAASGLATTLSGSAGAVVIPPPRSRGGRVAGAGAVVLGLGAIVTWAALRGAERSAPPAAAAAAAAAPVVVPVPVDARLVDAPSPSPAPIELATAHIRKVLVAFADWSKLHAGAPCPAAHELASAADLADPWGHAVAITCTAQPGDQRIGVTSAGPDGVFETPDDLASWTLGRDVTAIVRGPRWVEAAHAPTAAPAVSRPRPRPVAPAVPATSPAPEPAPAPAPVPQVIPVPRPSAEIPRNR
jgi:hypothetical protein